MKKLFFILVLIISTSFASAAQQAGEDVHSLMEAFKDAKHAEYNHVGKLLLMVAKGFIKDGDDDGLTVLKCINSVRVLDLEACSVDVKRTFWTRAKHVSSNGYRELIRQNTKDGFSSIQIKMKRGVVRELVIIDADGTDGSLVLLKGKIPLKKLGEVIDSQSRKKKK